MTMLIVGPNPHPFIYPKPPKADAERHYVCGFLFHESEVLLIRKRRPNWQVGLLNGIGGKVEQGESVADAMRREFREEAGVDQPVWRHVVTLRKQDAWVVHFFAANAAWDVFKTAWSATDETVERHPWSPLPDDVVPNLHWLIPLCRADNLATPIHVGWTDAFPDT